MCDVALPEVFLQRWRTARKLNRCTVCAETIRPGDHYHHTTGRWEGAWRSFKHCCRCWALYRAADRLTEGGAALGLDCGENWDDPPDAVAALAFLTRDEAQNGRLYDDESR